MTDHDDYHFTQDELLAAMRDHLSFTPKQIESNRKYHDGRLFLSEDVRERVLDAFDVGETVDPVTGELIMPQVTRDLDKLKDAVGDLLGRVDEKLGHYRHDDAA
jgi:hypothetical protein